MRDHEYEPSRSRPHPAGVSEPCKFCGKPEDEHASYQPPPPEKQPSKYPGVVIGLVFGVLIAGAVMLALMTDDNGSDYNPDLLPNGQTVQEKYGCADDELVYFNPNPGEPGVECVSHEEDARRQKGES